MSFRLLYNFPLFWLYAGRRWLKFKTIHLVKEKDLRELQKLLFCYLCGVSFTEHEKKNKKIVDKDHRYKMQNLYSNDYQEIMNLTQKRYFDHLLSAITTREMR